MKEEIINLRERVIKILRQEAGLKNELSKLVGLRKSDKEDFFMQIIEQLDALDMEEQRMLNQYHEISEERQIVMRLYNRLRKPLLEVLKKHQLSPMMAPFNRLPGYSEHIRYVKDVNREDGDIYAIERRGYVQGPNLIRAAGLVIVRNSEA